MEEQEFLLLQALLMCDWVRFSSLDVTSQATLLLTKVYYSYNSMDLNFICLVPDLCANVTSAFDIFLN